jgi:hypothetical protein
MFSVTADAPERPLSMKAFVPAVGTPFDQLAAFQTPPAAGPVQHVPADGHAAKAERGEKQNAARTAAAAPARRKLNTADFLFWTKTNLNIVFPPWSRCFRQHH